MKHRPNPVAFGLALGALGLTLLVLQPTASGQSPVGSWDVVLGGNAQRGVAHLQFNADGSIGGIAIFTVHGNKLSRTNGQYVYQYIFGSAAVQGGWVRDGTNRIQGYLNLISQGDEERDRQTVTNGFSLNGSTKPTRLNLNAHGPSGKMSLKGVPLAETNLVDLTGTNYLAEARVPGIPFPLTEIFTPSQLSPNLYYVTGTGSGYTYTGTLLISVQKYAAFYQERTAEIVGPPIVTYAGQFNPTRRRGELRGTDGFNTNVRYKFQPGAP